MNWSSFRNFSLCCFLSRVWGFSTIGIHSLFMGQMILALIRSGFLTLLKGNKCWWHFLLQTYCFLNIIAWAWSFVLIHAQLMWCNLLHTRQWRVYMSSKQSFLHILQTFKPSPQMAEAISTSLELWKGRKEMWHLSLQQKEFFWTASLNAAKKAGSDIRVRRIRTLFAIARRNFLAWRLL